MLNIYGASRSRHSIVQNITDNPQLLSREKDFKNYISIAKASLMLRRYIFFNILMRSSSSWLDDAWADIWAVWGLEWLCWCLPPAAHMSEVYQSYVLKMRISFDDASSYMALLLSGRVWHLAFFSLPVARDYRPLISFSREPSIASACRREISQRRISQKYLTPSTMCVLQAARASWENIWIGANKVWDYWDWKHF